VQSHTSKTLIASIMALMVSVSLSCGGGGGGSTPTSSDTGKGSDDFLSFSTNGAPAVEYTEASGLPEIDCDPRVDWGAYQVVLWSNHTGGSGPSGYETFFEIMFPNADSVGTYTVHGDYCQAMLYDGAYYSASPLLGTSLGTVQVTRSDTRIEGTFAITVVDAGETTSLDLAGSFAVDKGFSTSCP
jgi:hypothetical protein